MVETGKFSETVTWKGVSKFHMPRVYCVFTHVLLQIVVKEEMRRRHMAEHERRMAEMRKAERERERVRAQQRQQRRTGERDKRRRRTASGSPKK